MTMTTIDAAKAEPIDAAARARDFSQSQAEREPSGPDDLAALLKANPPRQPKYPGEVVSSFYVSRDGQSCEVMLDTSKASYSDWIKGEGADIGLLRDQETNRVVGAHLPLYATTLIIGGDGIETQEFDLRAPATTPAESALAAAQIPNERLLEIAAKHPIPHDAPEEDLFGERPGEGIPDAPGVWLNDNPDEHEDFRYALLYVGRCVVLHAVTAGGRDILASNLPRGHWHKADARTSLPEACRRLLVIAPELVPLLRLMVDGGYRMMLMKTKTGNECHAMPGISAESAEKILALLTFDEVPNAG